jgi:hypothetical protein
MKRFHQSRVGRGALACLTLMVASGLAACSQDDGQPISDLDAVEDSADPGTDTWNDSQDAPDTDRHDVFVDVEFTDIPVNPTALELVAMGKERLSAGESLAAMDAFSRAMDHAPGLQDAEWGMALARFQSTVSMFGALVGLINMKVDPDAPRLAMRSLIWPDHEGTIGVTIDGLYRGGMEQKARLDAMKAAGENPVFTLEGGLPLAMGDHQMMRLCCEWDRSDVYGISSFNNVLLALAAFLGSQDTDVSLGRVEALFKGLPGIEATLTQLLDEYPNFLTLLPESGEEIWRSLRGHVAAAADDALEAGRLMTEDDGTGNPVATLADGGIAYLLLHGDFPGDRQELKVLWEGNGSSLKAIVEKVAAHLGGGDNSRLSLDGDVLVAIGVLVDIINRTVGFQTLLDGMGFELPDIVGNILGMLDPEDPDQLVGMLGTILPLVGFPAGAVELDLATFFETPFNVRDFMPNVGPEPGTPFLAFLRSFECVRGGAVIVEDDGFHTCTLFVHDPSVVEAEILLNVASFEAADASGEVFDLERVVLVPVAGFTGVYSASVKLVVDDQGSAADDGILNLAEGGGVSTGYTSTVRTEASIVIAGTLADGVTPWDYGAACADTTDPWDGPRFGEEEFSGAIEVTAPGESRPVEEIAADGTAARAGMMAFQSPSFAGLIWLKNDTGFAPADQSTFGALLGGVMAALEAF